MFVYIYDIERNIGNVIDPSWSISNSSKVALLYASDYGYAVDFNKCSKNLFNYNDTLCVDNNWMYNVIKKYLYTWFINHVSDNSTCAWCVDSEGRVHANCSNTFAGYGIFPVLYLEHYVSRKDGDGSVNNPYQILVS